MNGWGADADQRAVHGGTSTCAVTLVEPLDVLDRELESTSTEGHRELVKEADLVEQDLPWSRRPRAEEPDLGPPFHTGQAWLRSEPERHICRTDKSCSTPIFSGVG